MTKTVRQLKTIDDDGYRLVVTAQLRETPRRYFSITSERGSDHERILSAFPELEPLVKLHLADASGIPMHAVANSRYFLEQGNVDAAAQLLHVATSDELTLLAGKVVIAKREIEELAKRLQDEKQEAVARKAAQLHAPYIVDGDRPTTAAYRQFAKEVITHPNLKKLPRDLATKYESLASGSKAKIEELHREYQNAKVVAMTEAKQAIDPVRDFVESKLPMFEKVAQEGLALLALPDFVSENYVDPQNDKSTYVGFAKALGLTLEHKLKDTDKDGRKTYSITLSNGDDSFATTFSMGSAHKEDPKIEVVLECLQLDARSADSSFEEWCSETGYDDDSLAAEKIYNACRETRHQLESLFGSNFEFFMEHVGTEELVFSDDEDDAPTMKF